MADPYWQASDVALYQGDARTVWRDLPEASVHALVTSPPYYSLRDYGMDGQLGLEDTPQEYVDGLAELLTDWGTSVLRPDGSLWLNLADSYGADKSLLMIPERVAWALRQRGWILRNRVVWAKPNGMPESVKDRLSTKHEPVFHFVRQRRYFYNLDAVREEPSEKTLANVGTRNGTGKVGRGVIDPRGSLSDKTGLGSGIRKPPDAAGVNPGDWWTIPTQPFPDAHFAVFPPELVRRPILATVPEGGVVADPFAGAGTTAVMARRLGRRTLLCELNGDYCALIARRLAQDVLTFGMGRAATNPTGQDTT